MPESQVKITPLNGQELNLAYQKAIKYFMENTEKLIKDYGWTENAVDSDKLLFVLSSPAHSGSGPSPTFTLPSSFSTFLDVSNLDVWGMNFQNFLGSHRGEPDHTDNKFSLEPVPISNIFCILQCIAPGMLCMHSSNDLDKKAPIEWVRELPPKAWVEGHATILEDILGSKDAFQKLLREAQVFDGSGSMEWVRDFRPGHAESLVRMGSEASSDGGWVRDDYCYDDCGLEADELDYELCSVECGYCKHCDWSLVRKG